MIVQFEGTYGGKLRIDERGPRFHTHYPHVTQFRVGVGQTDVGQGVVRVERKRFLEVFNTSVHPRERALVPVIATFQVEAVSVRVMSLAQTEARAFCSAETKL